MIIKIFFLIFFSYNNASAQDWNFIGIFGQSNGQFKSYLSNKIQVLDDQNVELTELQDFKNEQFHINGLYNSQIQKLIYNCKEGKVSFGKLTLFEKKMGLGKLIHTHENNSKYNVKEIFLASTNESKWKYACQIKTDLGQNIVLKAKIGDPKITDESEDAEEN
tara:strand:- start:249 stop:737 length:489 start_codon:yes stop_codon:yes gene_type:complete